ncbi:hypothetical protein DSL92_07705 [Billgrantia gudaonensis]|uniref:Uncharacterized protein n=1 Tax=Billgrantia gudaonensis TaxID=376427 RepID=A0A3S0QFM1_9GAMM|nr:hypothetical protein DSL92_07705 [Halomonas gudaonensis]
MSFSAGELPLRPGGGLGASRASGRRRLLRSSWRELNLVRHPAERPGLLSLHLAPPENQGAWCRGTPGDRQRHRPLRRPGGSGPRTCFSATPPLSS